MIDAILITPDGKTTAIKPEYGLSFKLGELQKYVDGNIEVLSPPYPIEFKYEGKIVRFNQAYIVVNEEGKIKGLKANVMASTLYNMGFMKWVDLLLGNVIVCKKHLIR